MNYFEDTTSLCFWRYFCEKDCENITEEMIAEWEYAVERAEYMEDWDEYING